jgi:hypothetical protein
MKTSMLVAIFAIGVIVASAGIAAAAGTNMGSLGTKGGNGDGNGAMHRNGGCHGDSDQSSQYRNAYDGECPCGCQTGLSNDYSWSCGEGNMNCEGMSCQYQGACPGTCDNNYSWGHSWNQGHCAQ